MMRFVTPLILLLLLAPPAFAKKHHMAGETELLAAGQFSAAEKHIIRNGVLKTETKQHATLPQGQKKRLAQGKSLPPGWQAKVVRGKRLDFHVYRHGSPLPGTVLDQLSTVSAGMELIRIGNDILRLQVGTHIVLDRFQLLQK